MKKKELRQQVYKMFGGHCAYCGEELKEGWHIDHITAVRRYENWVVPELDVPSNMYPSCPSCNINKHTMTIEEFRYQIERFVNSLNERITQYKIAKRFGLVEETGAKVTFYFEKAKVLNEETRSNKISH